MSSEASQGEEVWRGGDSVLGWIVKMKGDKKLLGSDHSDQNGGEGEIDKRSFLFLQKQQHTKRVLHFTIYANQSKKKLLNYSYHHFGANGCIEAAAC